MRTKYPPLIMITFFMMAIVLFFVIIIAAQAFLYPIALGILFSYLLFPITNFLENRLRFPRILAILLSIILGITVLVGAFYVIYFQVQFLASDMEVLKTKALKNVGMLKSSIASNFGVSAEHQEVWLKDRINHFFDSGTDFFGQVFTATTGTIVRIALLPVYVFFMLFYRDKAYEFIMRATPRKYINRAKSILEEISHVTAHYMGGVCIVVLILCFLNSIGLAIIGLEYAILFGIIAALCNFIPYFGTPLGFSFPLLFALFTGDSPHLVLGVVAVFIIVQFTENNILTPNIVGGNVRINPYIIILSLIVGAMVWGIPGMLVVVPFMAVIRIICENVDNLKPYAFLLGTEGAEKHAVTIKKIKQLLFFLKKRKM